jgi:hypothetical protein
MQAHVGEGFGDLPEPTSGETLGPAVRSATPIFLPSECDGSWLSASPDATRLNARNWA